MYTAKRILRVPGGVYLQLKECRERVIVETSVQFSNSLTLTSYSKIFGRKMAVISELKEELMFRNYSSLRSCFVSKMS